MRTEWLHGVIASFRTSGDVEAAFDAVLDQLFAGHPGSVSHRIPLRTQEQRLEAASFVIHAISHALDDHQISEREAQDIEDLKFLLRIEEGDLLAAQAQQIQQLLTREVRGMLDDGAIDDKESLLKSGLQRALGLGYDQFLYMVRDALKPAVERILEDARLGVGAGAHGGIDRLQRLGTFVRIDHERLQAIWPTMPRS